MDSSAMPREAFDLSEPDAGIGLAARLLAQRESPPFLFNHACRTYAFAAIFARLDNVRVDGELLYVGAMLHDLGLTDAYQGPRCFENESAAAAAAFARTFGWDEMRCEALAQATRLHMHPRVVPEDDAAGYLLSEANACDVSGRRLKDVPAETLLHTLALHPRLDFAAGFIGLLERQSHAKPGCLADIYLHRGLADRVRSAPFPAAGQS
jgi:hypothetical protein